MPSRRGALQALAERSGSDSDECMFDQTNLLERRRRRMDITRLRRSSATVSGHRLTVARTVNLCLSFFALGLCFVMPTATITGLQYRTSSTESAIEFIYTARYGGYIVGCFAGGFLFNWYNRQFLLFLALLATAIGVLVMPFCRVLATLMTCTCVAGVTMGLLDTGGNVWLLDLWGRKSAPFMQTMHFCFGLGALVAPLVAQPFVGAYNQLGAGGPGPVAPEGSSSSRTILSPMGPHSPSSVSLHSGSLRTSRDLHDGGQVGAMPLLNFSLPPTASTLPPVSLVRPLTTMTTTTTTTTTPGSLLSLAANTTLSPTLPSPASASSSSPSPLSSTVPVSLVTPTVTPQGSTTTQTARKKPQYAEAAPKPGKWDRTRISSAASSAATPAATPTARPTASNATGNVSVTSSVTTASTSSSCNNTRGCDDVGVAVPATTPAAGVIHEPLPTPTVRLQAGENSSISSSSFISGNSSHGGFSPPVEGDKTNSAAVSPPPSHLLPPRKNLPAATNVGTPSPTISTSTPSLPQRPSTTRPAMAAEVEDAKRRSKSHGKVLLTETEQQLQQQQQQQQRQQQQQQQSLVQSGLGSHQPAAVPASHDESTTKGTASTVPTQESVRLPTDAGAGAGDDNDNNDDDVPKKHHSIKKVLPEGAERDSWLEATRKKIQESGKFEIAYGILAAYVLIVSIVFLAFLCMNPREGRSKQEDELDDAHAQAQASRMRLPLIVLMCSFFFLYMGVEAAVGQTLKSLFQRDALLTPLVTGEQLVYIFWGSFALARGASIFISMKASCRAMLIGDILLCLVAALTLVLGAPHQSGLLIAGIVFLAVGMASIIPTSLIWLERCMQVTNRLSSLLILSAAAGKMMIPELVTAFIRNTPMALMYVVLGVILLCAVNLVALCYVTSVRGEKYLVKPDRSLYQLASLDDDIDHWNQEGGGGSGKTNSRQQPTPPPLSQHHQQPLQHNNSANLKRNKNNSFFYDRLNSLDS